MMVTLTANPSMDRTVTLETPLTRGGVHRASSSAVDPGGKGALPGSLWRDAFRVQ